MAKLLHMGRGALGIHTLPTKEKEGRPDLTTVRFVHVPPAMVDGTGAVVDPGKFEIDDEALARLLDPKGGDPFTKAHFASRRILRDDEVESKPEVDVKSDAGAGDGKPSSDKGAKGK